MGSSPFSVQHFRFLVRLMLGEIPVQRVNAFYEHKNRGPLHTFRSSSFCKRSCLFCVINNDTVVLDSEWHWIFDCRQFSFLREKYPHFMTVLHNIRENSTEENFSIETDLRKLFHSILNDFKCGFSLVAFLRQALTVRKTWLEEVCVRGHPGAPPPPPPSPPAHWNRNIFVQPLREDEAPENIIRDFDSGRPWSFAGIV